MLGPERIRQALAETTGFLDVAIAVCCLSDELAGIVWCVVCLMTRSGRPMIMVDTATVSDDHRRCYVASDWKLDPQLAYVREHHRPAHVESNDPSLLLPLVDSKGLLGAMRIGAPAITAELRSALALLANHVSVRFAELGVTAADEASDQLTVRQREVAELAAQGTSNELIAEQLALSVNTVKKHLKDVFDRLRVKNRTALSARLRSAPRSLDDIAVGITKRDRITITRGD